jgi:sugar phosphate permease
VSPPLDLGGRRWARLLPVAFVTYSLAYLDRSNFSIGVAGGMQQDLHLSGGVIAFVGASFFLGYCLFQVPMTIWGARHGVVRLLFWSLLLWGVLASLQGVLSSATALIVVRFLLGVVEGAVLPAMVLLLSRWFTRAERGRANSVLILGNPVTVMWLSAVSGFLVAATSWRGMFIIEGLPAVVWAFAFRALVRDRPEEASWLPDAERTAVVDAIADEQRDIPPSAGYRAALASRPVLLLCAQYLLWSLGVYGFVFWLPSIVKAGAHTGISATGLISAIPFAIASVGMWLNSRSSDRGGRRAVYVWPWLVLGAVAFYGSYLLGPGRFWPSFVLLIVAGVAMYAPYGPYFAHIAELLPERMAGPAVALVNSFGALGGFAGSYLVGWLDSATGSQAWSFRMLALSLALAAGLTIVVRPAARATAQRVAAQ